MTAPLAVVLRFLGAELTPQEFESLIGFGVEQNRHGQLLTSLPEDWLSLQDFFTRHSASIKLLLSERKLVSATLDVGYGMPSELAGISRSIPADMLAALVASGVSLTVSVYVTRQD